MPTGRSYAHRRRRRWPTVLLCLVVLAVAGTAVWWFIFRTATAPASSVVVCPSQTPTAAASAPAPAAISVRVLNSTPVNGLAKGVAAQLRQRGFHVIAVANAPDRTPVPVPAQLRFGRAGAAAAQVVARQLPTAALVRDGRTDATVDLVLGTGFTALRPAAQVSAATPAASPSATCAPAR